jgi:membrane-associated HD superfamily phosphohydrolase
MTEEIHTLYCYVHPNRETSLRCNRCERPICAQCAVRTPTGYRCKECVHEQQKIFNTAEWYDYIVGFGVAAILSLVASILLSVISGFIGFYMLFISFAVAGAAGVFIANITQSALRKRRSKRLFWLTAAGVVAGALPVILFLLFTGNLFSIIWQGIYLFTATPTVYARISGFQFSR